MTVPELRSRAFTDKSDEPEIPLPAGDVTEGVVRIGGTVRWPHQPQSFAVGAYLDHLERAGFEGSPRFLGRDRAGRDVLTFIDGRVAGDPIEPWVLSEELLTSVGQLVRRLHDASQNYDPSVEPFPPRPIRQDSLELVTHLDVTPQNVVVRDGRAFALIDFDLAGPSTRLADSYNAALHWSPLRDPADPPPQWEGMDVARRLRIFADAYGWTDEERRRLPAFGAERAELSWQRMKHNADQLGEGWKRMWDEGVGDVIRRRGTWLESHEKLLITALTS
ncbi:phosphotransferase [Arthrobacter sp. H5]|uniref:phosphotransferase n=1 Tax=Arthrobacter sp. H5 TaxID=1267973 RepID=UPI00047F787F|nr:phosphotransferase [Arthrobacter sp. H5]